ncbi:MAG: type II toxin-antitoxin system PemK/MazF family toxin [Rhizomicrobium sp.]|jgi:mRNA interferase MazF
MKRGDIVTVAAPGDYGKPRPAVVIQSDHLADGESVMVCLMTSTKRAAPLYRLDIPIQPETGLRAPSQIMIDKIVAVRRSRCGEPIGCIDATTLASLGRSLTLMIGIAD